MFFFSPLSTISLSFSLSPPPHTPPPKHEALKPAQLRDISLKPAQLRELIVIFAYSYVPRACIALIYELNICNQFLILFTLYSYWLLDLLSFHFYCHEISLRPQTPSFYTLVPAAVSFTPTSVIISQSWSVLFHVDPL